MYYLGIDIGGTNIKYGVLDDAYNILYRSQVKTDAFLGGAEIMNKVKHIVRGILADYKISAAGICTTGVVCGGKIFYANENVPQYTGTDIKGELESEFNIAFYVINDVNAAAVGEAVCTGNREFFLLTLGTGVGGAFVHNGSVYEGYNGLAGEIGYLPTSAGKVVDKSASVSALEKISGCDGRTLMQRAAENDENAVKIIKSWCGYIAEAIMYITALINPPVIVIGGAVSESGHIFKPYIDKAVQERLPEPFKPAVKIEFAKAKNDAGIIGAVYMAKTKNRRDNCV